MVVTGDKQGRLYSMDGCCSSLQGRVRGELTTLIKGSPINAILIVSTAATQPPTNNNSTLVAVGFDTSDLLLVSCSPQSPSVVLCRLGVGFTCIRSIALSARFNLSCNNTTPIDTTAMDVLCDGEVHTISVESSANTPSPTLKRRVVCASSVRCSSGLVVAKQVQDSLLSYRCVVGQGMEITHI